MAEQIVSPSLQSPFLPIRVEGPGGYDPGETARITSNTALYGAVEEQSGTVIGDLVNTIVEKFGSEEAGLIIRAAEKAAAEQEAPPAVNRELRGGPPPDPFRFSAAPPTVNREHGGIAGLAARGRGGDSMLVHMAPEEVAGLASLVPDGVTINPDTGLPEMFKLREIMPAVISIGANLIPGIGPFASAALAAAGSFAFGEGKPEEKVLPALLSGITSYGMGKLGSMIGGAGAETKMPGTEAFDSPAGGLGEVLLQRTGKPTYSWNQLQAGRNPEVLKFFDDAGIKTAEAYNQSIKEMSGKFMARGPTGQEWVRNELPLAPGQPAWGQVPTYTGFPHDLSAPRIPTGPAFRNVAASEVLNPITKPIQAAAAYDKATPFGKLGYMKEGVPRIDMAWNPTAPGRVGLGDLAGPAAATMVGIPSLLPPPEYGEFPGRPRYEDKGPYFPDERVQVQAPPGYRPGIDEQRLYFAAGGTRGKTVYAQEGYDAMGDVDQGMSSPTDPTGTSGAAADAAAAAGPSDAFANVPDFIAREAAADAAATASGAHGISMGGIPSLGDRPGFAEPGSAIGNFGRRLGTKLANIPYSKVVPAGVAGLAGLALGPYGALFGPALAGLSSIGEEETEEGGFPSLGGLTYGALNQLGVVPDIPDIRGKTEAEYSADPRRGLDEALARSANQEGTQGRVLGDTVEENIDVETAAEIPSGVAATTGIMQGAPMEVQDDVEVRLQQRQVEEPQNPRERAIYDRAVLALQNELEPEVAQRAIDDFLELFGPDALHMLQEMVRGERESGGIVKTVSGETTVEEGDVQGPDVIPGKVVNPVTGQQTFNLRVAENEYIETAPNLSRLAEFNGLPPTPENGAMIRGQEEEMLRQAVG